MMPRDAYWRRIYERVSPHLPGISAQSLRLVCQRGDRRVAELDRLSRKIASWGRGLAELEEAASRQLARWFAKASRGDYELRAGAEGEPVLTLRELAELKEAIEIYRRVLRAKERAFGGMLIEALEGLSGVDPDLIAAQREALLERRHEPPTPDEGEIKRLLAERFGGAPTVVVVSYHTNPLYAIRERVLEEEGIEIDCYDQGGQSVYQERLAYHLAEGFGAEVLTFTLGRSYLTKERYYNIHPRAPVIPVRAGVWARPYVEDDTGLIKKENLYFILDELVEITLDYLLRNKVRVDIFSGHYATGVGAARRLRRRYLEATGIRALYSATTHSLGWDKFVNTYYEYSPEQLRELNFHLRLPEERDGFREADVVIAVSPTEVETVTDPSLYGAWPEKVISIPGGVDTDLFRPYDPARDGAEVEALRKKYRIAEGDRVVLVAGRLWDYKRKGVDIAIEVGTLVKERVKGVKFAFVGLSPRDHPVELWRASRREVEALVRSRGLWEDSILVEMVPHEEMAAWLKLVAASGGVVLALPRVEPWGLMNLEAMAVGNVVVTIDEGGPPHYIRDGWSGILVDREDIGHIADRVVRALRDKAFARGIGENAHRIASREYSWTGVARKFLWAHLRAIDR